MVVSIPVLVELIGELCYNFSISDNLTKMVTFSIMIPDFDFYSLSLLELLLSYDPNICSTVDFTRLGNSDQVVVSISIDLPSNFATFLHKLVTMMAWDGLYDHLRDVPREDNFKLGAAVTAA